MILTLYSTVYRTVYRTAYRTTWGTRYCTVAVLPLAVLGVETGILSLYGTLYGTVDGALLFCLKEERVQPFLVLWGWNDAHRARSHGPRMICHCAWCCGWRRPVDAHWAWNHEWNHAQYHGCASLGCLGVETVFLTMNGTVYRTVHGCAFVGCLGVLTVKGIMHRTVNCEKAMSQVPRQ